jgi:hypothetical protein
MTGTLWDSAIGDVPDAAVFARMKEQGAAPLASPVFTNSASAPLLSTIGANGQALKIRVLEELTTIAAAATSTTTIQIPAGALVLAVPVRVVTALPGAATMTIGDGTTAAKFNTGSNIAVAAGTTDAGTKAGPTYYAAATSIVITPNATPSSATGRVRTTIFYIQVTPPTA